MLPRLSPSPLGLSEYPPAAAGARITVTGRSEKDLRVEERSILCLAVAAPRLPERSGRAGSLTSVLIHTLVVAVLISASAWVRSVPAPVVPSNRHQPVRLVFLQTPGPGGGGGGGGHRQPEPPSRAEATGGVRLTVRVAKPIVQPRPHEVAPPPPPVLVDAKPLSSGAAMLMGLPEATESRLSQGSGTGGGVGDGSGSGIGSGIGSGVGPGFGGGVGGGPYRLGSGVSPPSLITQVKPSYTAEALRRRIEGTVVLEAVVTRDGIPVAIHVMRSLDPGGLDEEAIVAARRWRFAPGRIGGTPVDVLVTILIDFSVR
jgi:periplasmic protein TonB